jgi:hypothetical protein
MQIKRKLQDSLNNLRLCQETTNIPPVPTILPGEVTLEHNAALALDSVPLVSIRVGTLYWVYQIDRSGSWTQATESLGGSQN